MQTVVTTFAPSQALLGGALIGLAAVILLASTGRLLGASGIISGLLSMRFDQAMRWRAMFLFGLLIGTAWTGLFLSDVQNMSFGAGPVMTVIGGLFVGIGVVLGGGCTSGHGICGIARFSTRSIAATITFMLVAIITVSILRHVIGMGA